VPKKQAWTSTSTRSPCLPADLAAARFPPTFPGRYPPSGWAQIASRPGRCDAASPCRDPDRRDGPPPWRCRRHSCSSAGGTSDMETLSPEPSEFLPHHSPCRRLTRAQTPSPRPGTFRRAREVRHSLEARRTRGNSRRSRLRSAHRPVWEVHAACLAPFPVRDWRITDREPRSKRSASSGHPR
jgi:hypothetical protein